MDVEGVDRDLSGALKFGIGVDREVEVVEGHDSGGREEKNSEGSSKREGIWMF